MTNPGRLVSPAGESPNGMFSFFLQNLVVHVDMCEIFQDIFGDDLTHVDNSQG